MLSEPTSQMDNQDLFSKLGESQNDLSTTLLGEDPFNDSAGDVFDKFLSDDFDCSNRSGGLPDTSLLMSANESTFQDMLDSTLDRGGGNDTMMLETNAAKDDSMEADVAKSTGNYGFQGNIRGGNSLMGVVDQGGNMAQNWFGSSNSNIMGNSQAGPQGNMLDAAPLNISLGIGSSGGAGGGEGFDGGGGGEGFGGVDGGDSFSGEGFSGGVGNESSNSIASMLRRKGSNAQMHGSKMGSVRKVGLTSSKLRSAKSEGMLARALKAKYNSGNSLNKYNVNAAEASAVINSRFPNSASAIAATQRPSQAALYGENGADIHTEKDGPGGGGKNATWGSLSSQKAGTSMFANLVSNADRKKNQDGPPLTSNNSMSSLLRQQKSSNGGSRTSMQDLLRLSKKQSKTQSALRQSSAQSLMKQTSSQSLKGGANQVDVSSLLPPSHAFKGLSISSAPSPKLSSDTGQNATFNATQSDNMEAASLLHQSCRLYPKTAAVVESALRIDPDAVRKAVPVTVEKGQKKHNIYGYPVNVAMTHGGSLEVIKMLIDAGPDVLVQKDGNDGAGSLGIALMNNANMRVIEMLIQANPECVKISDRRGNFPLHISVSHGLTFELVKRLHALYPTALQMRNFHSQTPLDIAQRSTRCSEEVMNYLQSTAYLPMEHNAHHLDQHNPGDLEDGLDDIMETNF